MLSAALIVKNEAAELGRCLQSLRGVVDEVVVVDTGSTDDTIALAEAHDARVFHFAWCNDFSAARNFAIDHCTGEVVLSIDADECVVMDAAAARAALEHFPTDDAAVGLVEIVNLRRPEDAEDAAIDYTARVFRRDAFRYEGAIHEQLVQAAGLPARGVELALTLHHTGYALSPADAAAKAQRNIALLRKELARHPHDEYFRYQLGKAWQSMGRNQAAAVAFEQALRSINFEAVPPRGRLGPVNRKVLTGLLCGAAYAHVANGEGPRAVELLSRHLALSHDGTRRADFHYALGHALLHAGRLEEAEAAYAAAQGQPEDVRGTGSWLAQYHLGLVAEGLGKREEARRHYLECAERWPHFAAARTRLDEM